MTSRCLTPQQTERFYRIWFALLHYVNEQRHLASDFPDAPGVANIQPADAIQLRNALWADDALREAFIADNPAGLPPDDLTLVAQACWKLLHRSPSQKIYGLPHRALSLTCLWCAGTRQSY
jgi:hypothetical protein